MGLFGKLFGSKRTLEGLRKAVAGRQFAEARLVAAELQETDLGEAEADEVQQLYAQASDELARLNLAEARGMRNCGQLQQEAEHLQLARELVCSSELKAEIETFAATAAHAEDAAGATLTPEPDDQAGFEDEFSVDDEQHYELILASYPPALAQQYRAKDDLFRQAFLLSHSGQDQAAVDLWQKIPPAQQDELYAFEFGALLGRNNAFPHARKLLESALKTRPTLFLALESLLPVLLATEAFSAAEKQLESALEQGATPAFCHAWLARTAYYQQQPQKAAEQARKALAAGNREAEFIQFAAHVVEQLGELDEAEEILTKLPPIGPKVTMSLPLAEFCLRHKRALKNVLDTYNEVCHQQPQNPQAQLRVAQTYQALGWRRDALKIVKKIVGDPQLGELGVEADQLVAQLEG